MHSVPTHFIVFLDFLEFGGACRMIQDWSRDLPANSLTVCAGEMREEARNNKQLKREFQAKQIITFPMQFFVSNVFTYGFIALQTFLRVGKALAGADRNAVLVLNTPSSALAVICHPLAWFRPKVYLMHGAFDLEIQSKRKSILNGLAINRAGIVNFLFHWMQRTVCHHVQQVIVFSVYAQRLATGHFHLKPRKIAVSLPPISQTVLQKSRLSSTQIKQLRQKFVHTGEKLFFVPSRIEPRKGIDVVLKAIKEVKLQTAQPFKVVFSGALTNGEYVLQLFEYLKKENLYDRVFFIDVLSRHDVYALYQAADYVLMPSVRLETLGLVTLESLFFGTPVIAFKTGAAAEIVTSHPGLKHAPLLIPPNCSHLATAMAHHLKLTQPQYRQLKQYSQNLFSTFMNNSEKLTLTQIGAAVGNRVVNARKPWWWMLARKIKRLPFYVHREIFYINSVLRQFISDSRFTEGVDYEKYFSEGRHSNYDNASILEGYSTEFIEQRYLVPRLTELKSIIGAGEGKKILDLGCGSGLFLAVAGRKNFKTYGVDISQLAVEEAKQTGATAYVCDLATEALPFPKLYFDVITAFDVVEHIVDTHRLFKEVNRVLKPGGVFYFITPNGHQPADHDKTHFSLKSQSEWEESLPANFQLLRSYTYDYFPPTPYLFIQKIISMFNSLRGWKIQQVVIIAQKKGGRG